MKYTATMGGKGWVLLLKGGGGSITYCGRLNNVISEYVHCTAMFIHTGNVLDCLLIFITSVLTCNLCAIVLLWHDVQREQTWLNCIVYSDSALEVRTILIWFVFNIREFLIKHASIRIGIDSVICFAATNMSTTTKCTRNLHELCFLLSPK